MTRLLPRRKRGRLSHQVGHRHVATAAPPEVLRSPGHLFGDHPVCDASNGKAAIIQDPFTSSTCGWAAARGWAWTCSRARTPPPSAWSSGGMAPTAQAIGRADTLRGGRCTARRPSARALRGGWATRSHQLWPVGSAEEAVASAGRCRHRHRLAGPHIDARLVSAGAHMTCVTRREMDQAMLDRADVIVQLGWGRSSQPRRAQSIRWPRGVWRPYVAGQRPGRARASRAAGRGTGQLPVARRRGRGPPTSAAPTARQVTLFVNTGTQGLQFAAVARPRAAGATGGSIRQSRAAGGSCKTSRLSGEDR